MDLRGRSCPGHRVTRKNITPCSWILGQNRSPLGAKIRIEYCPGGFTKRLDHLVCAESQAESRFNHGTLNLDQCRYGAALNLSGSKVHGLSRAGVDRKRVIIRIEAGHDCHEESVGHTSTTAERAVIASNESHCDCESWEQFHEAGLKVSRDGPFTWLALKHDISFDI